LIGAITLATFGQEKFIQSCRSEFAFDLGGRFTLCLANPNIFSPFKCSILIERPKLQVYLAIATTISTWSPNSLALCKHNPLLSKPVPNVPPCKKAQYNKDYLNVHT